LLVNVVRLWKTATVGDGTAAYNAWTVSVPEPPAEVVYDPR
jgi:hypothetical protein